MRVNQSRFKVAQLLENNLRMKSCVKVFNNSNDMAVVRLHICMFCQQTGISFFSPLYIIQSILNFQCAIQCNSYSATYWQQWTAAGKINIFTSNMDLYGLRTLMMHQNENHEFFVKQSVWRILMFHHKQFNYYNFRVHCSICPKLDVWLS